MNGLFHEIRLRPTRPGERLEIALSHPPVVAAGGALLLSPQPFLGGDLDNNVLRELARALAIAGLPVLRFNYRSVGHSHPVEAGIPRYEYWKQVEEEQLHTPVLEDADEALERATRLFEPSLLCGYSFGAFVALKLSERRAREIPLVLVAPPLTRLDFSELERRSAPTLMLLAGGDEFEPLPNTETRERCFGETRVAVIKEANHFFLGHESRVAAKIAEYLNDLHLLEQSACSRS